MTTLHKYLSGFLILAALTLGLSCERELDELEPATFPTTAAVFIDGFSGGLAYDAFGGSKVTAFTVDMDVKYQGTSSMQISVPDAEDPAGGYAGGVYSTDVGRDLSGYNVLTFWAKASQAANVDVFGIGNDLGENRYVASISDVPLTTNWQKYYIPIPDPSKLTAERGMFYYSESPENGRGYTFWVDEVRFENLGTLVLNEAGINDGEDIRVTAETGDIISPEGYAVYSLPQAVDQRMSVAAAYFDYVSSNPSVANTAPNGSIEALDAGETMITATLGGTEAEGSLTVISTGEAVLPTTAAPTPDEAAENVISLYSNAYEDEPVDYYNGFWEFSTTLNDEIQVAGDDVMRYTQLNFVGIQFTTPTIDISEMTHFHIDVWTPLPTDPPTELKIEIVDLGPNGAFGGEDDAVGIITATRPALQTGSWVSLDVPLSDLPGLVTRSQLAQVVLSSDQLSTVFVDNVYFYDDGSGGGGGGDEPTMAAPAPPTRNAADVLSLFSDAYNDVPVDTWRTDWSAVGNYEDVLVAGNATKKYSGLTFVGITTEMNQLDISEMTHFHIDVWSPDFTSFRTVLVDFGADGGFEGGDDSQQTVQYTSPPQGQWVSYDIALSDLTELTGRNNFAQLVLGAMPDGENTIFVDNIYFYKDDGGGGGGDEPTAAAPTPTLPAANVISLFSDAYDDVPVDTWRTDWSSVGAFEDVTVAGNATKKYSDLTFVGITTEMNKLDISGMTHFHIDVWSPDFETFRFVLVDFGADGEFQGGDDSEDVYNVTGPAQGEWVSLDIPLSELPNLTGFTNFAQLVLGSTPDGANTVFVDNIYFHN